MFAIDGSRSTPPDRYHGPRSSNSNLQEPGGLKRIRGLKLSERMMFHHSQGKNDQRISDYITFFKPLGFADHTGSAARTAPNWPAASFPHTPSGTPPVVVIQE